MDPLLVAAIAARIDRLDVAAKRTLNAAAVIDSDLDPQALNAWLHALEDAHGRDRSGPRFGDRPLDIDIVFYDALVLSGPGHLQLPRDELRHAFVLRPLAELDPQDVKLQLEAARAQLNAAEANLKLVRSERDRYKTLLARQLISQSQFDTVENQYRAGTVGYLNVLAAQTTVLSSQRSLIDVKSRRLTAVNALLKNVAGRWEALPPA